MIMIIIITMINILMGFLHLVLLPPVGRSHRTPLRWRHLQSSRFFCIFAIIKNFFAIFAILNIFAAYACINILHYLQSARISLHYLQSSRIFAFFAVIEICLHYSQPSRIVLHFPKNQKFLHSLHLAKAAQRATRLSRIVGQGYSQVGTFWGVFDISNWGAGINKNMTYTFSSFTGGPN